MTIWDITEKLALADNVFLPAVADGVGSNTRVYFLTGVVEAACIYALTDSDQASLLDLAAAGSDSEVVGVSDEEAAVAPSADLAGAEPEHEAADRGLHWLGDEGRVTVDQAVLQKLEAETREALARARRQTTPTQRRVSMSDIVLFEHSIAQAEWRGICACTTRRLTNSAAVTRSKSKSSFLCTMRTRWRLSARQTF